MPRLNNIDNNDSDDYDDGFKDVYDTMEFTNRHSRLPIKNWLNSRFTNGYDDSIIDTYSNSIPNSPNVTHMYITNNHGVDASEQVSRGIQSDRHTSGGQSNRNGSSQREPKSPPFITNGNVLPTLDERPAKSKLTSRSSQTQNSRVPDSEDVIKFREPSRPFVPVTRPIPNAPRVTQTESTKVLEYEFQELTMEFTDEPYPTLGRNNLKDRIEYLNTVPATEPKTEAKVFVNNNIYSNHISPRGKSKSEANLNNDTTENVYSYAFDSSPLKNNNTSNINVNGYQVNKLNESNGGNNNHVHLQATRSNSHIYYNDVSSPRDTQKSPSNFKNLNSARSNKDSQISQNTVQNYNNVISSIKKPPVNQVNQDPVISRAPSFLRKVELNNQKKITNEEKNQNEENSQTIQNTTEIPKPPPTPPPLPAPSFFKKFSKLNKKTSNSIQNNGEEAPNANVLKEISQLVNIHKTLSKSSNQEISSVQPDNLVNTTSVPHFTKQNKDAKLVKDLNELQSPNSLKKRARETPSPFTIDRMVDEAFDYISDDQLEKANGNAENKKVNGITVIDNYETFTDRAKKQLEDYQRTKKNSISNSSMMSSSKIKKHSSSPIISH